MVRPRGRPPRLSRQEVLTAALTVAEDHGLASVTMHAVAQRLQASPMALYRHVRSKQDLLDGIVEALLLELDLPDPAKPWLEQLRALASSLRATARRHPDVFLLLLQRPAVTPGALRVREAVYSALRQAGILDPMVPGAERLLSTFILGFAASEAGGRLRPGRRDLAIRAVAQDPAVYPSHNALLEHLRKPVDPDADLAWAEEIILRALLPA